MACEPYEGERLPEIVPVFDFFFSFLFPSGRFEKMALADRFYSSGLQLLDYGTIRYIFEKKIKVLCNAVPLRD